MLRLREGDLDARPAARRKLPDFQLLSVLAKDSIVMVKRELLSGILATELQQDLLATYEKAAGDLGGHRAARQAARPTGSARR